MFRQTIAVLLGCCRREWTLEHPVHSADTPLGECHLELVLFHAEQTGHQAQRVHTANATRIHGGATVLEAHLAQMQHGGEQCKDVFLLRRADAQHRESLTRPHEAIPLSPLAHRAHGALVQVAEAAGRTKL